MHDLPGDGTRLAATLPDTPRWLYARSLLLAGARVLRNERADAAVCVDHDTAVLVGRPDPKLLRAATVDRPTLLVDAAAATAARGALPRWTLRAFLVHALPAPFPGDTAVVQNIVVSDPLDPAVLDGLPDDVRADALEAPAASVRIVGGGPVAVCAVSDRTESLWDVGIDTVETARRRGHATAVFTGLAAAMARQGREPVWAAYEDYPPSLGLAARLGFVPVQRMVELTPPGARGAAGTRPRSRGVAGLPSVACRR